MSGQAMQRTGKESFLDTYSQMAVRNQTDMVVMYQQPGSQRTRYYFIGRDGAVNELQEGKGRQIQDMLFGSNIRSSVPRPTR